MDQLNQIDKGRACGRTQLTLHMGRQFVNTPPKPADNFQIVCWDQDEAWRIKGLIEEMKLEADVKMITSMDWGTHEPTGEPIYSLIETKKVAQLRNCALAEPIEVNKTTTRGSMRGDE